jgi:hypothetical protein
MSNIGKVVALFSQMECHANSAKSQDLKAAGTPEQKDQVEMMYLQKEIAHDSLLYQVLSDVNSKDTKTDEHIGGNFR